MRISATDVGFFEDYDDEQMIEVAVLGVDDSGVRRSFSIQRSTYPPNDQEISLGMDSYNVSDQRGVTAYGCLRGVRFDGNVVFLYFTAADAEVFDIPEAVKIELSSAEFNFRKFRELLVEVLNWGSVARRPQILEA